MAAVPAKVSANLQRFCRPGGLCDCVKDLYIVHFTECNVFSFSSRQTD